MRTCFFFLFYTYFAGKIKGRKKLLMQQETGSLNAIHTWQIIGISTTIVSIVVGLAAAYIRLYVSNECEKLKGVVEQLASSVRRIDDELVSIDERTREIEIHGCSQVKSHN